MTYLQLINSVMRRLREDEVATNGQDNYSKLIGDFVNETKREVEDAWNWTQLRSSIVVTTVASDYEYTLTGSGNRYKILQVINDTNEQMMSQVPFAWMNKQKDIIGSTNNSPLYYSVIGSSGGDAVVKLHPTPDSVETLNFYMSLPQESLTSDSTVLSVPEWPVILGTYAKALSERGEDGGMQFAEAAKMYNTAISDAIAIDASNAMTETDWVAN